MADLTGLGTKLCWLDTETTGLGPESAIVQLAAVSNRTSVQPFYAGAIIPADPSVLDTPDAMAAAAVHGLTKEKIMDTGEPAGVVWEAFRDWCHFLVNPYVSGDKLLMAGYNVGFDHDQVRRWWGLRDRFFGGTFWGYKLDVMGRVVEHLMAFNMRQQAVGAAAGYPYRTPGGPDLPADIKLGTVAAWMGVSPADGADLHNALADIELTRRVYVELRRRDRLMGNG